MTTIKMKRARLPKCPDVSEIRCEWRELSRKLRELRLAYIDQCFKSSLHLRGAALANYLLRVAERMIEGGLYSDGQSVGMTAFSIMCWFARLEVGPEYHQRMNWRHTRMGSDAILDMRKNTRRHRRVA